MTKIIIVRVGEEPKVEDVQDPFMFAKTSLLKGDYVETLTLPGGVVAYFDEGSVRGLVFNRAILAKAPPIPNADFIIDRAKDRAAPGEVGEHRIRGNFLLTRHGNQNCVDLTSDDILLYMSMLTLETVDGRCKRCGKLVAYSSALFCGAACSARSEAGE